MRWTWDFKKNSHNKRKHGIDFETAVQIFEDPFTTTVEDPHFEERRWRTIGVIENVIVMVVHTLPEMDVTTGDEIGRVITARKATRHERRTYEEGTY